MDKNWICQILRKDWKRVFGSETRVEGSFKLTEGKYGPRLGTTRLYPTLSYDMNKTYHIAVICTFVCKDIDGEEEYENIVTELR